MKEYRVRYFDTVMSVDSSGDDLLVEIKKNTLEKESHTIPKTSFSGEIGTFEEQDKGYIHNIRTVFKIGVIISLITIPSGMLMGEGTLVSFIAFFICIAGYFVTPSIAPKREGILLYSTAGIPTVSIPGKHREKGKEEFSDFVTNLKLWLKSTHVEPAEGDKD